MDIKVGDIVKTDYYPKDRDLLRRVIAVEKYAGASESGFEVTTKDQYGRMLACDANWYVKE